MYIRLLFTSDFTLQSLHKNLYLRTAGHVQRFPINLEVDPKAIVLANQFSNFSYLTFGLGSGDEFSVKIPAIRLFIVLIMIFVAFEMKHAIDQSSSLPSHAFPIFGIDPPLKLPSEAQALDPSKPELTEEDYKPTLSQKLGQKSFKEPIQVSQPVIDHSKPKQLQVPSQKLPEKTKWNTTDDSNNESWRIEYSDRGSDGDEITYARDRPKKVLVKKPSKLEP